MVCVTSAGQPPVTADSGSLLRWYADMPGRSTELDCWTIPDDDRLVNDARVGGDPKRKRKRYKCNSCGRTEWAKSPPECDNCHVSMSEA